MVSALAVVANLLFCSLAAYSPARMRFAGRGVVLALVVATILIPFQVVMIPLYLLMVQLGLCNTLLALIIPQAATAFGLYRCVRAFAFRKGWRRRRASMAAAGWERWNVMIPAARADLITLAMFGVHRHLSDFLWPLVILDDFRLYTLPLGLQQAVQHVLAGLAGRRQGPSSRFFRPGSVRAAAAFHPSQFQRRCGEGLNGQRSSLITSSVSRGLRRSTGRG